MLNIYLLRQFLWLVMAISLMSLVRQSLVIPSKGHWSRPLASESRLAIPNHRNTLPKVHCIKLCSNCCSLSVVTYSQEKSLAWVQVHDYNEAPASFGVNSWDGCYEMVPVKAQLPYKRIARSVNALDDCHSTTFSVLCRRSVFDAPIELAKLNLDGLRVTKEGGTNIKAILTMDRNLMGTLDIYDTCTRSEASVSYDGDIVIRNIKQGIKDYCLPMNTEWVLSSINGIW